jgi:hypothetical protein
MESNKPFYYWNTIGGTIISGQYTNSITVQWLNGQGGIVEGNYFNTNGCLSFQSKTVYQCQSVSFDALPTFTYGDSPYTLTASSNSLLPITYSSSNPSVATVEGNTVTIIGAGTALITASQSGNNIFAPAIDAVQTLTVNKANQVITFNSLSSKTFGDADFVMEASVNTGLPISYTSSNTAVATLLGNTIQIVGAGSTTITVSQEGDSNYNPASANQILNVNAANQTITFNPLSSKCPGTSFTLEATSNTINLITYTSSNSSIATVSGNIVNAIAAGTVDIIASQISSINYNAATVTQTLAVNPAPIATITTTSGTTTFCAGGSVTLTASEGSSYLWSTGATTPAITVSSAGNYSVTVTNTNGCNATSATTPVTITPSPIDGTISANATAICLGQSVIISSAGGTGTPYYWASTNGGTSWNIFSQQYGGQNSFTYTPTQAGTYRFHLRNQNSCGFCFQLGTCTTDPSVYVVVTAPPVPTLSGTSTFCSTGSASTYTTEAGMTNYVWSVTGGTITSGGGSTNSSATVTWSTGSGSISVRYTTAGGCAAAQPATLNTSVFGSPSISVSPSSNICARGYANLTANPAGASYSWSTGQTSRSITVYSPGYYTVTASKGSCSASTGRSITKTGTRCNELRMEAQEPIMESSELPNVTELSVFPNPTVGMLTVAIPEIAKEETPLALCDLMGKPLISSAIPQGQWKVSISLEDLAGGMYLVRVGYGDLGAVKKVMVKK